MDTLKKLSRYMGRRKALLPLAMSLSVLSELAGMAPYLLIWLIVRELLSNVGASPSGHVTAYAWWAAGLAVGSVALYFLALTCSHLAAFRIESNLRREAMRRITAMPLGFFELNPIGRIRKIIDDNASVTHSFLAHQLPDLAGTVLVPLVAFLLIILFDWRLGLACVVPVFVAMGIMGYTMNTKGREFMKSYMTMLEDMNAEAVEYVRGIPVVKVFQQTIYSFKNFHKSILDYNRMALHYTLLWERPMSCYTVIINSFVFFLVPLAILLTGRTGDYLSVTLDFFLFVLITPVFSQAVMRSMYLGQALGQAQEAVGRMESLLDYTPLPIARVTETPLRFDVSFEDVSFTYPGTSRKAIDGVSFTIPEGKRYALVGASGGGKTTIARMLPRFWDADEGEVRIGGVNVKDIAPEVLMQSVSFVFQNPRLFKSSLLENIRYGNPRASLSEVNRAIDMAQCREIIDRLPQGLDTRIGAEGTYLSGGERQRVVLARAILKDAPVIVLDEATAFADPENEEQIQKALKELARGKTVLMIAHRLSSVTDADRILVISDGKVAEQGTHNELLKQNGIYCRMWNEYQQSVSWTIGKEDTHD